MSIHILCTPQNMFISHFANPAFINPFCCCFCLVLSCARLFLSGAEHCTCRNNLTVLSVVIFPRGVVPATAFDSWVSRCSCQMENSRRC